LRQPVPRRTKAFTFQSRRIWKAGLYYFAKTIALNCDAAIAHAVEALKKEDHTSPGKHFTRSLPVDLGMDVPVTCPDLITLADA
jgi:hypothetical protein